jgi:CheY-like chemotaxis protein
MYGGPGETSLPQPPPGPPMRSHGVPRADSTNVGARTSFRDPSMTRTGTSGPGYNVSEIQSLMNLDSSEGGLKNALIVYDNEEVQAFLEEKIANMGYKVSLALNIRDAAKQLKFGRFQIVLLQEDYFGANVKNNQLLKAINTLELSIRRKMFIGLIGPNFTSLDDLMAFTLSLDTVINIKDIEDIEKLLISGMGHVTKFFSTYNELKAQRGES